MTPRERWLAVLAGREPDRIPTDYQATPEVTERLQAELGCEDQVALWRRLHVDKRKVVEPVWRRPHFPDDPQADMWGVRYCQADYGTGVYEEPCYHPLAPAATPADVHAHRWPDPDDFDHSPVARAIAEDDGMYPVHAGVYEPFLLYCYLRGIQQAFEDLAVNSRVADCILGHIFDFYQEHHQRLFRAGAGRIDTTYVAEDLGSQTGPLISLQTYRRFLLPHQIRMADLARAHGIHVMYHTDGAARQFLPDLLDRVGIEVLNPIQWRAAGMEREGLVADFGRRLVFHGSIDNQRTLPFGSADDVAREVRESVVIYRDARWICAPCHNLQPNTPTANIVALYETIHQVGRRN